MSQEKLSTKNTVFFSTANDPYIFQAATSLLSIRQFLPDAELYILSRQISDKNKRFLKRRHIKYIELDLTYLFFQSWEYPSECYYLFAGPKVFKKLGFKYSVYLDGDVLCLKNPIENCPPIHDIAGVKANKFKEIFSSEKTVFSSKFHISSKLFSNYRINSGVVYMNNTVLTNLKFLDKCGDLYYETWDIGCPRKGDDSLFALFQLTNFSKLSPIVLDDIYNYIPHYKGFKTDDSTIFFHFSFDKPWKFRPYKHEDQNQNIFNGYLKTWRQIGRRNCFWKWFNTLSFPILFIQALKKIQKGFIQIPFVLKGTRYPILKKRLNLKKPPINLYWWEPPHIKNFGDVVSPDLIFNIFGFNIFRTPIENCNLIATGSIIEVAQQAKHKNSFYSWGSGFIRSNSGNKNLDHIKFSAVRGKNTLSRIGYTVPIGDPGILINAAYSLKRKRHSKKIGVVIHYADIKLPITKKFCEDPRFEVISPLDSPQNVAQKIAECGLILSSSLHGLIFADSLSIPNAHIKISNNLTGGTYKFHDYYSGIDKQYQPANVKKIFDDDYLHQLKVNYHPIPKLIKKQKTLIKAFPFN